MTLSCSKKIIFDLQSEKRPKMKPVMGDIGQTIGDFIHCMKRPDGQSQFSRLLRDVNRRADAKLHNHIFSITGPAEPQSQALLLILSYKQREQHGRVVRAMDWQLRGSEFESHPYHNLDLFLFPGSNS